MIDSVVQENASTTRTNTYTSYLHASPPGFNNSRTGMLAHDRVVCLCFLLVVLENAGRLHIDLLSGDTEHK